MMHIIIYYNFILIAILTLLSFFRSESPAQVVSAVVFFPLFAYFFALVFPKQVKTAVPASVSLPSFSMKTGRKKKSESMSRKESEEQEAIDGEVMKEEFDNDRRVFLKIIGTAGVGLFVMSLFTKKAHAAFFGSIPGPGTVGIKDIAGELIDPAIKTPTDGYKISEVDDASSPAYYGFVNKTGAWFIMRGESSGAYRYAKGTSDFASNWTTRSGQDYDYFDKVFS